MVITLIGMAGAGKSTVGRMLAAQLGLSFIDIDTRIEQEEGEPLQAVLERLGEEQFLRREADAVLGLNGTEHAVIAPGGSIVYCDDAMKALCDISKVIHLAVPLEEIKIRIGQNAPERGIVGLAGKTLDELYAEREILYEKYAHLTVDIDDSSVESLVEGIIKEVFAQEESVLS